MHPSTLQASSAASIYTYVRSILFSIAKYWNDRRGGKADLQPTAQYQADGERSLKLHQEKMPTSRLLSDEICIMASPNSSGEQADSVSASVESRDCRTISNENAWKYHHILSYQPSDSTVLPNPTTTAIDDPFNGQFVSPPYILAKPSNPNPNTHRWLSTRPRKEHGSTSTQTQQWQWELGVCANYHRILQAQCFLRRYRPPLLLNTPTRGKLCLGAVRLTSYWNATISYYLQFKFWTFQHFRFWILWYAIYEQCLTPLTFWCLSSLTMDHSMHRSLCSQVISCIATATTPSPKFESVEKTSLAKLGNFEELAKTTCVSLLMESSMDGVPICAIILTSWQHELIN